MVSLQNYSPPLPAELHDSDYLDGTFRNRDDRTLDTAEQGSLRYFNEFGESYMGVCADQFREVILMTRRWRNVEFGHRKRGTERHEQ